MSLERVREKWERIADEHEATTREPDCQIIADWHDGAAKAIRKLLADLTDHPKEPSSEESSWPKPEGIDQETWDKFLNAPIMTPGHVYVEKGDGAGEWLEGRQVEQLLDVLDFEHRRGDVIRAILAGGDEERPATCHSCNRTYDPCTSTSCCGSREKPG